MGRMTPTPYEGHGGTQAEVAQAWRDAQRARYMDAGRSTQELRDRAERWLSTSPEFADTDGRPCPFAIEVVLMLRARHGRAVTKPMVLAAWRRYLAHIDKTPLEEAA